MTTGIRFLLIFCFVLPVHAGVHFLFSDGSGGTVFAKWNQTNLTVNIDPASSNSLSNAQVTSEINAALDQWQAVSSSSIQFTRQTTFSSPTAYGGTPDMKNYISFISSTSFSQGVIGITFVTADTGSGEIVDADIQFNKDQFIFITRDQGPSDIDNSRIVLANVATHEVGHFLGFDHSPQHDQNVGIFSVPEATMFPFFSDNQFTLEIDDISMVSKTYPAAGNPYTGIIQGRILNGSLPGDTIAGAHIVAWDQFQNPNIIISTLSGVTATGVNLDGFYRLEGLPPGNFKVLALSKPLVSNGREVSLVNDFGFLKQISSGLQSVFLSKSREFPSEYFHGSAESEYETDMGTETATVFQYTGTENPFPATITTNLPGGGNQLNLFLSTMEFNESILYANGTTNTVVTFTPKNTAGNPIEANISSRLKFTISTGSFSATTAQLITTPTFLEDGSFSYFARIYSVDLPGTTQSLTANVNAQFDGQNVFTTDKTIQFQKPHPTQTDVKFIANIDKFNSDGLDQTEIDVFADGTAPATWRITPKFSNGTIITEPIDLNPSLTSLSPQVQENTITTSPLVSVGNNQYQTTMTRSEAGVVIPVFKLDGIELGTQSAVKFSSIGTTGTSLSLSASTIHIKHPSISPIPTVELCIKPKYDSGSFVTSLVATSAFNILYKDSSGNSVSLSNTPISQPTSVELTSTLGPCYKTTIEAISTVGSYTIEVEAFGNKIVDTAVIRFDVSDPQKSEIRTDTQYLLANSSQFSVIEFIPRFADSSLVASNISSLVFLSASRGYLENSAGQKTSVTNPSIRPDFQVSGLYTVKQFPTTTPEVSIISGTVQANGFQAIADTAQVNFLNGDPGLLSVSVTPDIIAADGLSLTTVVATPLFPDGTPLGKEFSESRLKASISDGEFLKKTANPLAPGEFILQPAGTNQVTFFNQNAQDPLKDGTFELSVRSSNFATVAVLTFYVDGVLSLITKNITFSVVGSADSLRTDIQISEPVIYADGKSLSRIDVFPKDQSGAAISLPNTSTVVIQTNHGQMIGALIRNSDASYTQYLRSDRTSINRTAFVTVTIDGIQMQPAVEPTVRFINMDISQVTNNIDFPDNQLVDGYDVAILARSIRDSIFRAQICSNNDLANGVCVLDLNGDKTLDEKDIVLLEKSYGKATN